MSNQINPFNYNIDNFDSGFLGPISDTNFRNFLFTHSLASVNPIVGGVLGGNPLADRGTEYDIAQSTFNVIDIPNLTDVAVQPSFYNNLTEPRPDNLDRNLQQINQQVVDNTSVSSTNPDQEGRNVDAATLLNINPTIIDLPGLKEVSNTPSFYNNFTNPKQDNLDFNPTKDELISWYPYQNYINILNQEYDTYNTDWTVPTTLRIGYVGNVDEWVLGGNIVTTSDVRDRGYYMLNNVYGPKDIIQYYTSNNKRENNSSVVEQLDEVLTQGTGFKQYNTKVSGDFRDALLSRSLGVGIIPFSEVSSGINYEPIEGEGPSELDKEARKRRGIELKNRIQLNFVDDTLGIVNTNVFGLLAGGTLLNRDFSITRPKSTLGKVADFIANLTGFNYPKSILEPDDLNLLSYNKEVQVGREINPSNINEIDVASDLLDRTGKATRELIIDTTNINKYGPNFEGEYTKFNDGTYLSDDDSLITKQNQKRGPIPTNDGEVSDDTQEGGFYGQNEYPRKNPFSYVSGFNSLDNNPDITDHTKFVWTSNETENKKSSNPFKKGLLKYTQNIVNNSKSDLNKLGGYIGYFDSLESKKDGVHKTGSDNPSTNPTLPSKGNQVRNVRVKKGGGTEGGDLYCRSWASTNRFGKSYEDLVRSGGNWWLGVKNNKNLVKDDNSLLTMNYGKNPTGIPKIAWTKEDLDRFKKIVRSEGDTRGMVIPYMFSIENLAWKDAVQYRYLPPSERGPNSGRIMWFPPYNLNFSENNSVNWETTSFIGRGEPIYTYNNSERTGNLDFTIIVDHPSVLNQLRDDFVSKVTDEKARDNIYHSFFAGCNMKELEELFSSYQIADKELTNEEIGFTPDTQQYQPVTASKPKAPPFDEIKIYFENCRSSTGDYGPPKNIGRSVSDLFVYGYEDTKSTIAGDNPNLDICSGTTGLNAGVIDKISKLVEFLLTPDGKNYKINIVGYTSPADPSSGFNQKLAEDRVNSVYNLLYDDLVNFEDGDGVKLDCGEGCNEYYPKEVDMPRDIRWSLKYNPLSDDVGSGCPNSTKINGRCPDGNPCSSTPLEDGQANSKTAKLQRYVSITLEENTDIQTSILNTINLKNQPEFLKQQELKNKQERDARESLIGRFITEMDYFSELERTDPVAFKNLHDKIDNFHPAFHSMTPEGLNSRLTFLLQCTRQGPQLIDEGTTPQNMVFGRPPICVLRIGDFYHTKIVIDSVNITYEPLQWDLNPEGIGVQPMIAKVSMGFKFIGGSSLGGPIKQLQNAVSYNFFANTGVYRPFKKIVDDNVQSKKSLVYGAFLTPDQAEDFYNPKLGSEDNPIQLKEVEITAGNDDTSNVTTDDKTKKEIEDGSSKNLDDKEKTTDGDNKPKTTTPKEKVDVGQIIVNANGTVTVSDINTTVKKGGTYRVLYKLVNKMISPVIITNVSYSDCPSCTKPTSQFPKQPVLKNQTIDIWVYDTPKIDLYTQKSANINLITNGPKSIVIKPIIKPE